MKQLINSETVSIVGTLLAILYI